MTQYLNTALAFAAKYFNVAMAFVAPYFQVAVNFTAYWARFAASFVLGVYGVAAGFVRGIFGDLDWKVVVSVYLPMVTLFLIVVGYVAVVAVQVDQTAYGVDNLYVQVAQLQAANDALVAQLSDVADLAHPQVIRCN